MKFGFDWLSSLLRSFKMVDDDGRSIGILAQLLVRRAKNPLLPTKTSVFQPSCVDGQSIGILLRVSLAIADF